MNKAEHFAAPSITPEGRIAHMIGICTSRQTQGPSIEQGQHHADEMLSGGLTRTTLEELQAEGYDQSAYARGPWLVEDKHEIRLINALVVRHPDGRVVAFDIYRLRLFTNPNTTITSSPVGTAFATPEEYAQHAEKWHLTISDDVPLTEVIGMFPQPEEH